MRQCLFCDKEAHSLEDAWPRWITDQFRRPEPAEVEAERNGVPLKPWRVRQPELTVRRVCRTCNNGWMSKLEERAKVVMQPMLSGQYVLLDQAAQALLAVWSVKTAMVLEALAPAEQWVYSQIDRERFRTLGELPWRTSIWLAAVVSSSSFLSTKNRHLGDGRLSAASTTMAFACVAIQVLTLRPPHDVGPQTVITAEVRKGAWRDATVGIWPHKNDPAAWPPQAGLNGELGLNLFADRFITTSVARSDVDTLVI